MPASKRRILEKFILNEGGIRRRRCRLVCVGKPDGLQLHKGKINARNEDDGEEKDNLHGDNATDKKPVSQARHDAGGVVEAGQVEDKETHGNGGDESEQADTDGASPEPSNAHG